MSFREIEDQKSSKNAYRLQVWFAAHSLVRVRGVMLTVMSTLHNGQHYTSNPYDNDIPPRIPTKFIVLPPKRLLYRDTFKSPLLNISESYPMSHHQPVEAGNTMPQSQEEAREEVSHTSTIPRLALDRADEAMTWIVPIDRSNTWEGTWEGAVGRIKWAMDTLSPIADVRIIPF